jgi:hypothetical protein
MGINIHGEFTGIRKGDDVVYFKVCAGMLVLGSAYWDAVGPAQGKYKDSEENCCPKGTHIHKQKL